MNWIEDVHSHEIVDRSAKNVDVSFREQFQVWTGPRVQCGVRGGKETRGRCNGILWTLREPEWDVPDDDGVIVRRQTYMFTCVVLHLRVVRIDDVRIRFSGLRDVILFVLLWLWPIVLHARIIVINIIYYVMVAQYHTVRVCVFLCVGIIVSFFGPPQWYDAIVRVAHTSGVCDVCVRAWVGYAFSRAGKWKLHIRAHYPPESAIRRDRVIVIYTYILLLLFRDLYVAAIERVSARARVRYTLLWATRFRSQTASRGQGRYRFFSHRYMHAFLFYYHYYNARRPSSPYTHTHLYHTHVYYIILYYYIVRVRHRVQVPLCV